MFIAQMKHSEREKILWFVYFTLSCQYFGPEDLHRDTRDVGVVVGEVRVTICVICLFCYMLYVLYDYFYFVFNNSNCLSIDPP